MFDGLIGFAFVSPLTNDHNSLAPKASMEISIV
jgi:hypothetical protein